MTSAAIMRRALEYTAWLDVPIVAHEEEPSLVAKGYMNEGSVSAALGCLGIPAAAEEEADPLEAPVVKSVQKPQQPADEVEGPLTDDPDPVDHPM